MSFRSGRGGLGKLPGQSKKSFMPNLASAGKRQEPTTAGNEASGAQRGKANRGRGRGDSDRSRGRGGRKQAEIIQTDGLFSKGISAEEKKTDQAGTSGFRSGGFGGGGGGSMKYRRVKVEDDDQDNHVTALKSLRDDADVIETDEQALKKLIPPGKNFVSDLKTSKICPLNLTMADHSQMKSFSKKLKIADYSAKKSLSAISDEESGSTVAKMIRHADNSEDGQIFLLQLPSVVSGAFNHKDTSTELNVDDTLTASHDNEFKKDHVLSGIPAGKVGKMQILASGRVRLLIGDLAFDVDKACQIACQQEVVTIETREDAETTSKKSGQLTVVGGVKRKLNCVPDFDQLFEDRLCKML